MEERVSGYRGVHFDFISGVVTFKYPSIDVCAPPALPIRFLVAGVYDEVDGVFAWGWAVTGLPEHVRDEVAAALRDRKSGLEPHHAVFEVRGPSLGVYAGGGRIIGRICMCVGTIFVGPARLLLTFSLSGVVCCCNRRRPSAVTPGWRWC